MPRKVTIILLGDGSVGKSCMAIRYLNNEYLDAYDPTIQDTYRKTVMIDGEPVVTEIIDTSGQDEYYSNSIESLIMKGNGFLFVYNIVIPDSLEKLDLTIQNVFQLREATVKNPKGGMVICGNKCDRSNERKIPTEDGVQLAAKYDANFFETSAKMDININLAFETVIRKSLSFMPTKKESIEEPTKKKSFCMIL